MAEHERTLGDRALIARLSPEGLRWWQVVPRRRGRVSTGTYEGGLDEALAAIDDELHNTGFAARYTGPGG